MAPKRTANGPTPAAKRHKAQQELDPDTPLANLTPEQTASSPSKPNKRAKTSNAKAKEGTASTQQKATSWFVLPYKERPRFVEDKHEMIEECVLGYRNGENESDLQGGVTQPRQSKEIQTLVKRYQGEIEIPIAKDQRNGFVWVAEAAPQGMYTVNVDQMVPIEERHFADSTCDICGANCTEVLHVFRCYRRRREGEASTGAARKLHPFVAYISLECGRGLLSSPSSLAKLREQVYTTFLRDGDSADAFRQMMRTLPKEHRQAITEELRFYAGSMEGESQRKTELRQAETTYGALQHGASDPFRAVASTLSSGGSAGGSFARTLATTTLFNAECCNIEIKSKSFLESVKVALEAGLPLPQAPVPLDFEDAKDCLELLHLAWPMIEIELNHTLQGPTRYQKQGPSEIKSRLFYLPGCSELHAPLTLDSDAKKAQERAGLLNTIKGQSEELIKDAREYFAQGSDRKMVVSRNVSKAQDRNILVPDQQELVKLDDIKNVLETISWPCCFSRPNVKPEDAPYIEAFPIGMVLNYCLGLCLSHTLSLWPNLTKLLTRMIRQEHPDFKYTTIQLNRDYAAKMHVDGNNFGPSYIIALGDFTGGELWIMDKEGDKEMEVPAPMRGYPDLKPKERVKGRLWDAKNKWVKFNGNVPHQAMPFKGSRISLVFFSRKGFERLKDDTRSQLETCGFPIPPPSEAGKTEEMEVMVEEIGESGAAEVKFADLAEEEIDEDEEVDQFMQGEEDSTAWNARNWAQDIQQLLGVDWQQPGRFKNVPKLKLFVCNVGSGAPACALREMLPERLSEVYAMSHISKQLARFGRRNFKPGHMFESEEGVTKGAGTCFTHRTCCHAPPSEEDIFVGSFSALPFLGGKDRLKRSFMEDRRSALFVHMRKHLEVRKPKVAVLEATDFAAVPATQRIPLLSILLDGKDKNNMEVGLRLLKDYAIEVSDLDLRRLGLPVAETRVHFVLVLKEAGGEVVADKICDVLRRIQEDVVPRCSLKELLFKSDDRRLKQVMTEEWLPKKKDGQQRLGEGIMLRGVTAKLRELRRNPPAAGARLYCDMKDSEVDKRFPHATEQQRMHLNVAYEHAKQTGLDVDRLVVDLSQPMVSAAWRDDGLLPGRLTLGAEEGARVLYSFEEKRILTAQEELLCYGFPVWRLSLQGLTDQQVGQLSETAMAVTCIGATLSAVLALANLGKERAELRASEFEITNLISKMSSRRTGLAATALEVLASQANAGTEQGGSEVEVRAATLLSLLRHDLTAGDSNEAGGAQAKEGAEEVKKTLQKLEGLEEKKDANDESAEIDIQSLPLMTSTTGQQEPMDFEARRKKIMHVPDTWPWEALLRWTAEAAEDPFAPEALQIMMHGTKQLRLRIQRKQAVSDRQLQSTDKVIGLLRASDRMDLADELEAAAMAEMYARMEVGKSGAGQGARMDSIRYIEGLVDRCKRSGWRPRHWLLNHVAETAHKAGKEEVMKCFDDCKGWQEMVTWLHNVPKDAKAWSESGKSLVVFANEAEHRAYLLAPVFAAADRLDQAAVAKKCLKKIVEITTSALTDKVENPIAEGIKKLHGEVGNVFTDSQRAVVKAREFATMSLVGMREEELKKLLKQAQGLDTAKEPLRKKDEFAPLLELLEREVSHALKTIANAMQARMNSVKDAQNKKEAKLLEDELQKHLSSSGQLINVDDVHSFAQKMQRFAEVRKKQATPKQEELANKLSKAVTEHCELPARRQAAERLLRAHGLGSVVPLLRESGLLETLPTLKTADLPKALVGPTLDMMKELLDGNDRPREEDLAPPPTLPPGWQARLSSRFGLMIYSTDDWRTAQFERPYEALAEDADINVYAIPSPELAEEEQCMATSVPYMVRDSLGSPFCLLCRRSGNQHFNVQDQGHTAARTSWQLLLATLRSWLQALDGLEQEKPVPRMGEIWRTGLLRFFQRSTVVPSVRNLFWWQVVQERLPSRDAAFLQVRKSLVSMIAAADQPEKLDDAGTSGAWPTVAKEKLEAVQAAMSMSIDKGHLNHEDPVGQRHAIAAVIQLRQLLLANKSIAGQQQLELLARGQNALRRYAERSVRSLLVEEWLLRHSKISNARDVVQHFKDKEFLHRLHQVSKRPDLASGLPPKVFDTLRDEIAAGDLSEARFLPPLPLSSKWARIMSRKLGLVYFQSVEDPKQTQWAIPLPSATGGTQPPVSSSDSGEESA